MVANNLQCAKPQTTKTIFKMVQRARQVLRCKKTPLSLLKARKQGSNTLNKQFVDANTHTRNSTVSTDNA